MKPHPNSQKRNSGQVVRKPLVDCSDLPVVPFRAIDCSKQAFAHLRQTGPGYISLATSASLVEERDDD